MTIGTDEFPPYFQFLYNVVSIVPMRYLVGALIMVKSQLLLGLLQIKTHLITLYVICKVTFKILEDAMDRLSILHGSASTW